MATQTRASGIGSGWTNSGNITVLDTIYATASMNNGSASPFLVASNFGFSLPVNSVINSISFKVIGKCAVEKMQDYSNDIGFVGGSYYTNKVDYYAWSSTDTEHTRTYTPTEWGWSGITASDINSSNFSYRTRMYNYVGSTQIMSVDYVEITVDYTPESKTLGEYIPNSSTKLYLRLNGNSYDQSGNNNNGIDTAITYSQANGKFRQGAGFNGSSSKISTGVTGFPTLQGNKTISCWFNVTSLPGATNAYSMISFTDSTTSVANSYQVTIATSGANSNYLRVTKWGGAVVANTSWTPTISTWYYLTVTYDGTNTSIYIDGSLKISSNTAVQSGTTAGFMLGNYWTGTNEWFNGKIDEVIIENRAWSASEVSKYYTMTKGRFGII